MAEVVGPLALDAEAKRDSDGNPKDSEEEPPKPQLEPWPPKITKAGDVAKPHPRKVSGAQNGSVTKTFKSTRVFPLPITSATINPVLFKKNPDGTTQSAYTLVTSLFKLYNTVNPLDIDLATVEFQMIQIMFNYDKDSSRNLSLSDVSSMIFKKINAEKAVVDRDKVCIKWFGTWPEMIYYDADKQINDTNCMEGVEFEERHSNVLKDDSKIFHLYHLVHTACAYSHRDSRKPDGLQRFDRRDDPTNLNQKWQEHFAVRDTGRIKALLDHLENLGGYDASVKTYIPLFFAFYNKDELNAASNKYNSWVRYQKGKIQQESIIQKQKDDEQAALEKLEKDEENALKKKSSLDTKKEEITTASNRWTESMRLLKNLFERYGRGDFRKEGTRRTITSDIRFVYKSLNPCNNGNPLCKFERSNSNNPDTTFTICESTTECIKKFRMWWKSKMHTDDGKFAFLQFIRRVVNRMETFYREEHSIEFTVKRMNAMNKIRILLSSVNHAIDNVSEIYCRVKVVGDNQAPLLEQLIVEKTDAELIAIAENPSEVVNPQVLWKKIRDSAEKAKEHADYAAYIWNEIVQAQRNDEDEMAEQYPLFVVDTLKFSDINGSNIPDRDLRTFLGCMNLLMRVHGHKFSAMMNRAYGNNDVERIQYLHLIQQNYSSSVHLANYGRRATHEDGLYPKLKDYTDEFSKTTETEPQLPPLEPQPANDGTVSPMSDGLIDIRNKVEPMVRALFTVGVLIHYEESRFFIPGLSAKNKKIYHVKYDNETGFSPLILPTDKSFFSDVEIEPEGEVLKWKFAPHLIPEPYVPGTVLMRSFARNCYNVVSNQFSVTKNARDQWAFTEKLLTKHFDDRNVRAPIHVPPYDASGKKSGSKLAKTEEMKRRELAKIFEKVAKADSRTRNARKQRQNEKNRSKLLETRQEDLSYTIWKKWKEEHEEKCVQLAVERELYVNAGNWKVINIEPPKQHGCRYESTEDFMKRLESWKAADSNPGSRLPWKPRQHEPSCQSKELSPWSSETVPMDIGQNACKTFMFSIEQRAWDGTILQHTNACVYGEPASAQNRQTDDIVLQIGTYADSCELGTVIGDRGPESDIDYAKRLAEHEKYQLIYFFVFSSLANWPTYSPGSDERPWGSKTQTEQEILHRLTVKTFRTRRHAVKLLVAFLERQDFNMLQIVTDDENENVDVSTKNETVTANDQLTKYRTLRNKVKEIIMESCLSALPDFDAKNPTNNMLITDARFDNFTKLLGEYMKESLGEEAYEKMKNVVRDKNRAEELKRIVGEEEYERIRSIIDKENKMFEDGVNLDEEEREEILSNAKELKDDLGKNEYEILQSTIDEEIQAEELKEEKTTKEPDLQPFEGDKVIYEQLKVGIDLLKDETQKEIEQHKESTKSLLSKGPVTNKQKARPAERTTKLTLYKCDKLEGVYKVAADLHQDRSNGNTYLECLVLQIPEMREKYMEGGNASELIAALNKLQFDDTRMKNLRKHIRSVMSDQNIDKLRFFPDAMEGNLRKSKWDKVYEQKINTYISKSDLKDPAQFRSRYFKMFVENPLDIGPNSPIRHFIEQHYLPNVLGSKAKICVFEDMRGTGTSCVKDGSVVVNLFVTLDGVAPYQMPHYRRIFKQEDMGVLKEYTASEPSSTPGPSTYKDGESYATENADPPKVNPEENNSSDDDSDDEMIAQLENVMDKEDAQSDEENVMDKEDAQSDEENVMDKEDAQSDERGIVRQRSKDENNPAKRHQGRPEVVTRPGVKQKLKAWSSASTQARIIIVTALKSKNVVITDADGFEGADAIYAKLSAKT